VNLPLPPFAVCPQRRAADPSNLRTERPKHFTYDALRQRFAKFSNHPDFQTGNTANIAQHKYRRMNRNSCFSPANVTAEHNVIFNGECDPHFSYHPSVVMIRNIYETEPIGPASANL
jgi:hypothetical protein